ncbi:MAG: helix-turn-helix transcriptional regulator [Kiritimatiellae bacterium]|jgi:transcriptional regulator with XRE-family HTH domain|nr:helix-turn-helix transcriptional regulator [Kiritimatiellia bacterium]
MKRNRFSDGEETLRKLLRKCRVEAGLRQEDLAEKLNVHQSFVSKYESGERLLTFVETINICRALGLDLNAFLAEYLPHHDS